MKKSKTYIVPIRSTVYADRVIEATSKDEAYSIVSKEMKESMARQLKNVQKNKCILNMSGHTEVIKSSIWIKK